MDFDLTFPPIPSTAANRFMTHNGGNFSLAANHMALALYDTGVSR